ncbi:hypothetical protein [Burkholderia vietnamiensis]|uniref:hypothetical protein n=1 Tax=Burkholderia vietnamiensis TaxID=60552 RepID=UPI001B997957|nr:hypothetical protein [Burkholderia vietnamiensis]MBR8201657.1 hypothetical protein [Burkholderia vietnamiensis]
MMTTDNSRADVLTDLQIMEALEAAGVKWQEQRSLANDREILTFGSTPAADIIAGIRTLLAAFPVEQPAPAPIAYDGLTEEFTEEVTRLANDAPGIREAVAGALASCNAIIVPLGGAAPAPSPADERAAMLAWAVERWDAEVKNRPLINVHRRSLDDTWRQVIRHCGGDDVSLIGPRHDALLAANPIKPAPTAERFSPAALIMRDCCETDPDDPKEPSTICISHETLTEIVERHTTVTACCGRSECGGECGNEWRGRQARAASANETDDYETRRKVAEALGIVWPGTRDGKRIGYAWSYLLGCIKDASANETGAEGADALAHELWSAAQRAPGEGIEGAVQRIAAILSRSPAMAAEAVGIPAGWKAMPPSATTAMRMAMAEAAAEYMRRTGGNSPDAIYEAGFAAAPQPAQADARVGLTDEQREAIQRAIDYADMSDRDSDAEALRAILQGANQ